MKSAAKWGAIVGVSSYLVLIVGLTLLNSALFGSSPADLDHPGTLTLVCLGIFGICFAFSAAGYFTGRETRKAGLGAISAVIALIVYYVLSTLYTPGRTATGGSSGTSDKLPMVAQVLSAVVAGLVVMLLAAGMGWLGARPAVQQAERRLARRIPDSTKEYPDVPTQDG
jgi:putative flippase GtrA